nr:membrane-spanning 4-domains subfamily A member 4A-like [Cavia porcellus]
MAISMNVLAFYYPFLNHNQTVYTLPMCFSIAEGLKSMVLILSLLELSIAVALSTFGCKVACGFPGGVVLILPSNPPVA